MALDQGPPPRVRFGQLRTLESIVTALHQLEAFLNRWLLWQPFAVSSGSFARAGTAQLTVGTVTINNQSITAKTLIFLSPSVPNGTVGTYSYTVIVGTSFTITSSSTLDTSTLNWVMVEQN